MDIGRTIRNIRTRKGLKAGELAERIGVSKSYISRIEREHRRINTELLEKIGKILEVPPAVLLGGSEEEEALGLLEEMEAIRKALLDERRLNPRFIDHAVKWLADLAFPSDVPFDTAGDWELGFQEVLGGEDGAFRRLLRRFQDIREEILSLNPRPQTPYPRFRESSTAALQGLSTREKADLISALLPTLLRNRKRWSKSMKEVPVLIPLPVRSSGEKPPFPLQLPKLTSSGEDPETLEILPNKGAEHLRAAIIEDSSMSPKYEPGDVVVFTTRRTAKGGERAVVGLKDGRWMVRIYRKRGQLV